MSTFYQIAHSAKLKLRKITQDMKQTKEPDPNCDICKGSGKVQVTDVCENQVIISELKTQKTRTTRERFLGTIEWESIPCYDCCQEIEQ